MRVMSRSFGIAAAAALMATTTAASAANPAASLSVQPAATTMSDGSNIHSSVSGATLINIGILAALVVIVLVATRGSNNGGSPASP